MKIKPLHDRILVRRLEEKEVKKGGIIIPDTAKEKPQEGEVVAVGPGKVGDDGKRQPMDVKVGDKVLYQWGDKLTIDGVEYEMVAESGILAIIK